MISPPFFLAQCVAVVSRYVQKCTHTIALSDVVTSKYIHTYVVLPIVPTPFLNSVREEENCV